MYKTLIEHLSAEKIVSGEMLANELGVSRMTISKRIKKLISEGYDIIIVPNKGYRLGSTIDILDYNYIKQNIDEKIDLQIFDTIDSTNTYAKNNLVDKKQFAVVIGDEQTSGRGRFDKKFQSPKGTGIYMSFVIPCNKSLEEIKHATCAVAVIVAKSIESFGSDEVKIKWVNDLFINDKKVCGILTEATTDLETATVESMVIGIGINVHTTKFFDQINASNIGINVSRNELIVKLINELCEMSSYEDYMNEYRRRSLLDNVQINFTYNNVAMTGIVKEINSDGNLVVKCENEEIILHAGEVSIGSDNVKK